MKRIGVVLLFVAALGAQAAPPKPAEEIAVDLRSDDAATVAWAADAAREAPGKELDRALQTALTAWSRRATENADLVRLHLLDAMIARKTRVPGELLAPMLDAEATGVAAFVQLCREPLVNERTLFELFRARKGSHLQWVAMGNLLAANRAAGFAALLWQTTDLAPQLAVREPGEVPCMPLPASVETSGRTSEAFPVRPIYFLCAVPNRGAEVLAPGAKTISFARAGAAPLHVDIDAPDFFATDSRELEWLVVMAGTPAGSTTAATPIVFRDVATYTSDVTAARERLLAGLRTLREALVTHKALTADEAKRCELPTNVQILDRRTDKTTPLPDIPAPAKRQ